MSRLYIDSGYYSRRGTQGRVSGGIAGVGQTCQWTTGGDGSYFWGMVLPNGSVESCPTGGPPSAPPVSPSNTAGQNIVNQNAEYANLPYLNSPAYLAAEAASGATPQTPAQMTASELATYCAQNLLNAQQFGDPLDLQTCTSGGAPQPSYLAQANALTSAAPVPTSITPAPSSAPSPSPSSPAPTASITNTTRGGSSYFQVGDGWKLTITGAPNATVTDTATQNGNSLGTTAYGATGANGQLVLTGTMDSGAVGNWTETWAVGGVAAPAISFSVVQSALAPPATGTGNPLTGTTTGGTTGANRNTNLNNSQPATCSNILGQTPGQCLGPLDLVSWGVIAAGAAVLFMVMGGRR